MNTKLSQSILKKINQDDVAPKSRWRFIARRVAMWVLVGGAVIFGALATSALIYVLTHAGWQYASLSHGSFWRFTLETLPYLWVLLAIIFVGIAFYTLQKTEHGYRYQIISIMLGSIILSIALGVAGYAVGIGRTIDNGLGKGIGGFESLVEQRMEQWSQPEQGRLAGDVRKVTDVSIRIKDIDGFLWDVDTRQVVEPENFLRNTLVDRNSSVRIFGYIDDAFPNTFHACVILPLEPPRRDEGIRLPKINPVMQRSIVTQSCRPAQIR